MIPTRDRVGAGGTDLGVSLQQLQASCQAGARQKGCPTSRRCSPRLRGRRSCGDEEGPGNGSVARSGGGFGAMSLCCEGAGGGAEGPRPSDVLAGSSSRERSRRAGPLLRERGAGGLSDRTGRLRAGVRCCWHLRGHMVLGVAGL